MILREIIAILIACSWLSPIAAAQKAFPSPSAIPPSSAVQHTQDFSEIVVPITSVKTTPSTKLGITGKLGPTLDIDVNFGTGFCLDVACRFIATNYHVAVTTRADKIKREKIVRRYFATGPHDEGATANNLPNVGVLPYAEKRDVAIFELRRSLPHHHEHARAQGLLVAARSALMVVDEIGEAMGHDHPFAIHTVDALMRRCVGLPARA